MTKSKYVSPTIARNYSGLMSKHGHVAAAAHDGPTDEIDRVSVEELVREHGSPLYVFSEETLRKKYRDAYRAFSVRYPKVQFAWSYKTNYLRAICNVFHSEGSIAEVVSDFEYEKARKNGIPGNQIIFNGPYKRYEILRRAAADGAKIQIDNAQEIVLLERVAKELGRKIPVAIRVTIETGNQGAWKKFGFSYENGDAMRTLERLAGSNGLRLVGLHAHIGTFILDPQQYKTATAALLNLARRVKEHFSIPLEYFNLGGGFASASTLHYQYLPGSEVAPSFTQYAEAICDTLNENLPSDRTKPTLYLETGRALVDEAGYLITTVLDSRRSGEGRQSAILDAGVNLLYTSAWYKYNIRPTRERDDAKLPTTLYGPLCMNIDVVRDDVGLPPLQPGDRLVLHPVGAYNITQSMQFITYRPAVVMVGPGGHVDLIRKRENLEHIEALEVLPERLARQAACANPTKSNPSGIETINGHSSNGHSANGRTPDGR